MLAVFAILALATTSVSATKACTGGSNGSLVGTKVDFQTLILPAGQLEDEFYLPTNVCPANTSVKGAAVQACDEDVAPAVNLHSPTHGTVVRKSDVWKSLTATLDGSVYCS